MAKTLSLAGSSSDPTTRRTLSHLSLGVAKSKKIIVVTGAGISCSCGIPDFRSSDGLYNLVKQQYPDVVLKGRDLFDASLFRDPTSTSVFYTFISKLKQSIDGVAPSPTHQFIRTLDMKGKLLRSYTQNIDGLEERVGLLSSASEEAKSSGKGKAKIRLRDVKNVQLHGDIRRVRCTFCSADYPFTEEHGSSFVDGIAPSCPDCILRSEARVARSARALRIGNLRPAIVLYDEPHPLGDEIGSIQSVDLSRKPELLIIMGTSLKVHGLKRLVKEFAKAVHATAPTSAFCSINSPKAMSSKNVMKGKVIFVNKTPPSSEWDGIIDYHVEGETDTWVECVLEDWKRMRPADWEVQTILNDTKGDFKVVKSNTIAKVIKTTKGGKKSRRIDAGEENIPPISPSTLLQESQSAVKNLACTSSPSSPSKRRQGASHYSNLECSPSKKKHTIDAHNHDVVPSEERGMLFGTSRTVNRSVVTVEIDSRNMTRAKRKFKRQQSQSSLAGLEDGLGETTLLDSVFV